MAKVVYWCIPNTAYHLNFAEPEPLLNDIMILRNSVTSVDISSDIIRCPAVHAVSHNVFVLRSPIDISFTISDDAITTKDYNQNIFNQLFAVRDIKAGFLSLTMMESFFFTEEDCNMIVSGAYLANNDAARYLSVIPGMFNIAKWFRNIDFAFFVRDKNKEVQIKTGDPLIYLRFDCKDPIVFKKFYCTNTISEISRTVIGQKVFQADKSITRYLPTIYSLFNKSKIKTKLLNEIKNNLME